jgi:hypothetical protein
MDKAGLRTNHYCLIMAHPDPPHWQYTMASFSVSMRDGEKMVGCGAVLLTDKAGLRTNHCLLEQDRRGERGFPLPL